MQYVFPKNFIRFVIYGIVSAVFDYVTYITFLYSFKTQMEISKICGLCIGLLCSYILNYHFNFSFEKNDFLKRGIKYILLYLLLNALNVLENRIFFVITHSVNVAYILSGGLSATVNYYFIKKFIFK